MKNDYGTLQKKIDKLLWKTNEKNTGKTYHEMYKDPEYKLVIQKIGELMMELENINSKDRNKEKSNKKLNN